MFWGRNKKTRKGKLADIFILHIAPYFILDLPPLSKQTEKNELVEGGK
jgi:hypothetical protein